MTETVKHTPGPWRVREVTKLHADGSTTLEAHEVRGGNRVIVVDVTEEADARLIAAAPEMLDALDHIGGLSRALRQGGPDPMDLQGLSDALEEAVDLANALVARAEGRS